MLQVEMTASVREVTGKGPMRQLRMKGMTPAVVYGRGSEASKLQLDSKILMSKLLQFYRRNTIVTLKVDGQADKSVMIGEVQTDPVRDTLVHVDFCEIDLEKVRCYSVPVKYTGTPKGVDLGGELIVAYPEIELKGKPLDIPDELTVDITPLQIGHSIKIEAISMLGNVELVSPKDATAVSVAKKGEEQELEEDETTEVAAK